MNKRIAFRNMDHSGPMEQHANDQLAKIEKFLESERSPVLINLTLTASHVHEHPTVELTVKTPNYDRVVKYEHEGMDCYQVLDHVIDTMYRLLHEDKRRHVDELKEVGRHDEFKKQR
jgi:ribosomal subunit interface protein